jgi:hypothetical protein
MAGYMNRMPVNVNCIPTRLREAARALAVKSLSG